MTLLVEEDVVTLADVLLEKVAFLDFVVEKVASSLGQLEQEPLHFILAAIEEKYHAEAHNARHLAPLHEEWVLLFARPRNDYHFL